MFTVSRQFNTAVEAAAWLTGGSIDNMETAALPVLTSAQKAAATKAKNKAKKEAAAKEAKLNAPVTPAVIAAPVTTLLPPVIEAPVAPVVAAPVVAAPVVTVDRSAILGEVTVIVGRLLASAEKDQHTTYFTNLVRTHGPTAVKASDLTDDLLPAFLRDLQTYEASLQSAPVAQQPLV